MNTEAKLRSLINSVQVMTSTLNLDEVLEYLIKEVLHVIDGSNASVLFLYDEKINRLYAKTAAGFDMKHLQYAFLKPGEGMSGKTFLSEKGQIFSTHTDTLEGMQDINPKTKEYYSKARGDLEYPASAICVPLKTKQGCIGVLTVDIYEENVTFTPQDLQLLETFATQAVIAIENATLFSRNERTQRVHEVLSEVSLSQGGLDKITKALASLVQSEVIVHNEFFDLLETSSDEATALGNVLTQEYYSKLKEAMTNGRGSTGIIQFDGQEERIYFFPVRTDDRSIGLISMYLNKDDVLDPLDQFAVEQTVTIFALEITRRERSSYHALTYSGYILDQLLNGKSDKLTLNEMIRTTSGMGEERKYLLVQLTIEEAGFSLKDISHKKEIITRIIRRKMEQLPFKPFILDQNLDIVFMFSYPKQTKETVAYERIRIAFAQIIEEVKQATELSLVAGIGRTVNKLDDVRTSANDASKCVDYLRTKQNKSSLLAYFELGFQRLFLKTEASELEGYVEETIGQLKRYDQENKASLLITLSVYLDLNKNMKETAESLFIHVNTVKYRLRLIREILGIEEIGGEAAFELQLAVNINRFLD
ncbi:helix-turn-helix domain-containing protein [Halobacillus locisalis]|uniref:Helix-turn-helix domain-containing protein n=1 Tax=Halobacillus locisalis TaxID=220753 RepID=A0A838CT80_9BACI|nr:helix-turn-helix domain-containing protein [Halobacillus locisalis]MBA2174816.1 helix-turn-helix domain-containing protein [Halobacillus locisalis]